MKRPDFFIIGAPKCGTTSLSHYLDEHAAVFMSNPKEPGYFNSDFRHPATTDLETYQRYFAAAGEHHLAVGEATVFYLYSRCAVPDILRYNPAAKFIVCVRNPIEMAPSWHSEAVHNAGEDLLDFEAAWRARPERARGRRIPRYCREPGLLDYGAICCVGSQLKRLYQTVPRDRVHVVLLDDLRRNPRRCYDGCLAFLGLPSDARKEFPVYNASRRFRFWTVHRLCYWSRTIKRSLGVSARFNIARTVQDLNVRPMPRPPLSPGLHAELRDYFAEEISLLGSLLGRDLHHWLSQRHRRREREPH